MFTSSLYPFPPNLSTYSSFFFSLFLIYSFYCFTQTHIHMFCCLVASVTLLYVSLSVITILLLLITKRDVTGDMYSYNCECTRWHANLSLAQTKPFSVLYTINSPLPHSYTQTQCVPTSAYGHRSRHPVGPSMHTILCYP